MRILKELQAVLDGDLAAFNKRGGAGRTFRRSWRRRRRSRQETPVLERRGRASSRLAASIAARSSAKSAGKRRDDLDRLVRGRMPEPDALGVERLPRELEEPLLQSGVLDALVPRPPVDRVARRPADPRRRGGRGSGACGRSRAGSAGESARARTSPARSRTACAPRGSRTAALGSARNAFMRLRSRGSRPIAKRDLALADARDSGGERQVLLAHRRASSSGARGTRGRGPSSRRAARPTCRGPGGARCPGASSPPTPFQVAHVVEERVHERARGVAGSGMDDEPRRLVDREQVRRLRTGSTSGIASGSRAVAPGLRHLHLDLVSGADDVRALGRGRPDAHGALLDQLLDARAREVRAGGDEEEVEPRPGGRGADAETGGSRCPRGSRRRQVRTAASAGRPPQQRVSAAPMNCEVERTPGITKPRTRSPRQISMMPRVIE